MNEESINVDKVIQDLTDAIAWGKQMLANQPHLIDNLNRLEGRLFESVDELHKNFAAGYEAGGGPCPGWPRFVAVRNEIVELLNDSLNNRRRDDGDQ